MRSEEIKVVCVGNGQHRERLLAVLVRVSPPSATEMARWAREQYSDAEIAAGFGPPTPMDLKDLAFDGWGWRLDSGRIMKSSRDGLPLKRMRYNFREPRVSAKPDGTRVLEFARCPSCGRTFPGVTDDTLNRLAATGESLLVLGGRRR